MKPTAEDVEDFRIRYVKALEEAQRASDEARDAFKEYERLDRKYREEDEAPS